MKIKNIQQVKIKLENSEAQDLKNVLKKLLMKPQKFLSTNLLPTKKLKPQRIFHKNFSF